MKAKGILLILALAVLLTACSKPQAANPQDALRTGALAAYQEILKAAPAIQGEPAQLQDASFDAEQNRQLFGDHYDWFSLADLNQDGVPELIAASIINFRWVPISVFTYADGKAVLLDEPAGEAAHGTFEHCSTANGAYSAYICAENHIHSLWRGTTPAGEMEENYAYVLTGTALTPVECAAQEGENLLIQSNTEENVKAMGK